MQTINKPTRKYNTLAKTITCKTITCSSLNVSQEISDHILT